jgi:CDP-diacylglycerol--serine O-phosphatidyltransferase
MNAANALTLLGLAMALSCALFAADGHAVAAIVALIGAGLCDFFDGFVARKLARSEEEKAFGGHLDSVVDACAFGIAPALLLHGLGLRAAPERALLVLFASCAVWRLAYFDTVGLASVPADPAPGGAAKEAKYYTGLPTTYVALVFPIAALAGFAGALPLRVAMNAAALGVALAMVSPLRIKKPGGKWYAIFLVLAIVMIAVYLGLAERFAR